jgi:DNA invertase Pin-like site-specific DNA recombinase
MNDLITEILGLLSSLLPAAADQLAQAEKEIRQKYGAGFAYIHKNERPTQKLERIKQLQRQHYSIAQIEEQTGYNKRTIYRLLNKKEGTWQA